MKLFLFSFVCFVSGCSSFEGIIMDEKEKIECRDNGCTVWTLDDLKSLGQKFYQEGYKDGVKSI